MYRRDGNGFTRQGLPISIRACETMNGEFFMSENMWQAVKQGVSREEN